MTGINAHVRLSASALAVAVSIMTMSASELRAQTAAGAGNESHDIVVTARKRAEALTDVPVAVSVLGSADINRYAAADLEKISGLAPQVSVTRGQSGGGANISIRGLGSGSGDQALEQTVSINLDGVQVGRGRILSTGMFDLQQVEVLKGPQALYFGKNSPAGVISLTSQGPTDSLSGYVRSGYEFVADEAFLEGAISGPITNNIKARLALRGRYMKGYLVNTAEAGPNPGDPRYPASGAYRKREPRTKDLIGRLTVEYDPGPDTNITLRVLGSTGDEGGFTNTAQAICFTNPPVLTTGGVVNPGSECKLDRYFQSGGLPEGFPLDGFPHAKSDGRPFQTTNTWLPSLTINHDFGQVSLTSVTGYFDMDFKGAGNSSYTSLGLIYSTIGEHSKQFSQELRLNSDFDGPLNFTFGGYYAHNSMTGYVASAQIFRKIVPDPATGYSMTFSRATSSSGDTYSGFGQLRWNIFPNVELAGGVRYTREHKEASTGNVYVHPNAANIFAPAGLFLSNSRTESNWSPEFTATWHPVRGQTLYAAYKTGYKAGGISQPSVVTLNFNKDNLLFNPERTKGGEVGYKAELMNGRLRFDLTGYYYKIRDLQVVALIASNSSSFLTNAGVARTQGIESSVNWTISDAFSLRSSIGYNDAKYLSFANSPCYPFQTAALGCVGGQQDLSGRQLVRAPKWNILGGGTFTYPIGSDMEFTATADVKYTSSFFTQDNEHPLSRQSAYTLIDASARIEIPSKGLEFAVVGRNLTNRYYRVVQIDTTIGGQNQFGAFSTRPREISIQASYKF
ncbi:hypothetical protein DM806_17510 [Sphingobium lactosutens]|uniref:TonB-dependent receptor n=1 Tax=Sphingobium lactosutens TaxID=522773 RepID=UPI0015BD9913|nr:TonB-dependent receptor [Sphingobium lactosutens]NWK97432.1 hypothetical protein [Sphingobium lactosutens]